MKLEDQKMQFSNRLSEIEHYQRSMRIGPVNNNPRPQGMKFKKYFWPILAPTVEHFLNVWWPWKEKKIVVKAWLFLKIEIHSHQHRGLCQGKYIKAQCFFLGEKSIQVVATTESYRETILALFSSQPPADVTHTHTHTNLTKP